MCESRKNTLPYPFGSNVSDRGQPSGAVLSCPFTFETEVVLGRAHPRTPGPTGPIRHHVRVARGRFRHGHNVECNCACTTQRHARKSWRVTQTRSRTRTRSRALKITDSPAVLGLGYRATVACPPHHYQAVTQAQLWGRLLGHLFVEPLEIMLLVSAPRILIVATTFLILCGRCPSRMPLVAIRIHVHT